MRVALTHMRHAETGGTERYLNQLAAALAVSGHEVTIVCRTHGAAPHPDVRFVVRHDLAIGAGWRMWAFAKACERHVRETPYDVVFGLGRTTTQDVLRLGGGLHATYLELAHGATLHGPERFLGRGLKHRLAPMIEARALAPGAYRRIIANSDMVKRDVIARYAVPAHAIETIYNGVDLERFHPRRRAAEGAELRAELGLGPEHRVVLFLGTGYGRKGLDLLLDAFPTLARERPEAHLVVVGFDSARPRYEARAKALGLAQRVTFLGGRPDAERCYAAADLYVLPTRYDPFANSTLEALASGLPVVTTTTNGAAEILAHRASGSVVALGDGREALTAELSYWCDPDHVRAGAEAARALAERHSAASKTERTEALLREVADEIP